MRTFLLGAFVMLTTACAAPARPEGGAVSAPPRDASVGGPDSETAATPQLFRSRDAALKGGCRPAAVKGPGRDTCVLTGETDPMTLDVYEQEPDGSYRAGQRLTITSWSFTGRWSTIDPLGDSGTDWLVIETTGMHGTGIHQDVLFVIAWDGMRFRTVAAESLDYRCSRPTSPRDYRLVVEHGFAGGNSTPGLQLAYELFEDERRIARWSDSHALDAGRFAYAAGDSRVTQRHPALDAIRRQIDQARTYARTRPLDPVAGSSEWLGDSGLMDVLNPVCLASPAAP